MKNILFNKMALLIGLSLVYASNLLAIVPEPAQSQSKAIALVGATVHVGNGQVIKNALLTFNKGKINAVEVYNPKTDLSSFVVIDVKGQQIYPGFIVTDSTLGLTEVGALRATHDEREKGELNPNIRSIVAYNTDSELIPTLRFNGVLMAQVVPQGGIVSGRSSVVELDGWNWEDAAYVTDKGLHVNWPSQWRRKFNFSTFTVDRIKNKNYKAAMKQLLELTEQARAYQKDTKIVRRNIKLAAMRGLFNGKMTLYVHTNTASEMIAAIQFAKQQKIAHLVIVGGAEALEVTDELVKNKVPVILSSIHRLPNSAEDSVNQAYQLPAKLTQAGVKIALGFSSNMSARNLPFLAGSAASYGLSKEQALSLITKNPAEILGIDDQVGTLEKGKVATLIISKGDALDMRTNIISNAYISGKDVDLQGVQQQLYQRYHKKYQ